MYIAKLLILTFKINSLAICVPEAGLEPARLSTVDFESTASTIPPLGQVHKGAFKRPCALRQSRTHIC